MAQNICRFYHEIKMGFIESTLNSCKPESPICNNAKKRKSCELGEIFSIANSLEIENEAIMQKITAARCIVKKNALILENSDSNVLSSRRFIANYQDKLNKALEASTRSSGIIKAKNMEIKGLWEQYRVKVKIMEMLESKAPHI